MGSCAVGDDACHAAYGECGKMVMVAEVGVVVLDEKWMHEHACACAVRRVHAGEGLV